MLKTEVKQSFASLPIPQKNALKASRQKRKGSKKTKENGDYKKQLQ